MTKQRAPYTAYLVGACLFGASKPHLDTGRTDQSQVTVYQDADRPNPTNEAGICRANDRYLPSGFYEALENSIPK